MSRPEGHNPPPVFRSRALRRLDLKDTPPDELGQGRGYGVANEAPSATVQPSGNPISFSHSSQVKFLAT